MDKQRIRFLVRSDCAEKKSQVPKKLNFFLFHFFNRCFVCMFCVRSIHTGTHGALAARLLKLLLKVVECYRPSNGLSISDFLHSMGERMVDIQRVEARKPIIYFFCSHLCQCLRRSLFPLGTLFPSQCNAGSHAVVLLQHAERCYQFPRHHLRALLCICHWGG